LLDTHPSKDIVGTKGNELKQRRIVLCITGSVAAVECPEIARTLMRHGAEIYTVMSPASLKIIHPYLMQWATGNDVVTELTGGVEHVTLAGEHHRKADFVLVAPATANTISKIACGIDDTTVTSVVSTAFGSAIPIVVVPAMHESMYKHPVLIEHIKKLKTLGVEFIGPRIQEGKAKIAKTSDIARTVIQKLTVNRDLSGLNILITSGPTIEFIDPVRVVTNRSSGKMGAALAEAALSRGAQVTLVYGPGTAIPPTAANVISVETTDHMYNTVIAQLKSKKHDVMIAAAAAADWTVEKPFPHKVSTHRLKTLDLRLKPTKKIINSVKKVSPHTFVVAFRAEYKLSKQALIESAYAKLMEARADLVVVNDVGKEGAGFGTETNEVFIVDREKKPIHVPLASKREVADRILDVVKIKLERK
jgi:phosphopantothenoylcysteine decarboxylase/phosphopantothenate--cysteine ligase